MKLFSTAKRPVHMGPYPLERWARVGSTDLTTIPKTAPLSFDHGDAPASIVNAMRDYQAMLDALRAGATAAQKSTIPTDPLERANHLKSFGYFNDASMVGICRLDGITPLGSPHQNPDLDRLRALIRDGKTKTLAAGIDLVMAELREALTAEYPAPSTHTHALVFLYEHPRDPAADEPGTDWILNAQDHRAALRASETAVILANYIRLLGWHASAHTPAAADFDLNTLAVASGLATVENGALTAPYLGTRFGIAAVTCTLELAPDLPLAPLAAQSKSKTYGAAWKLGKGTAKSARTQDPFAKRRYVDGAHPFETLKRVDDPTTYIDAARVARVPKRADMFARAQFGDLGPKVQKNATGGLYVRRTAPSMAQRRALSALLLLQDAAVNPDGPKPTDAARNAANLKATAYFLGIDAVGLSACPDWVWYSHDATGAPVTPPHDNAISMIIDQGFETMEGASGDDWISVAQSMRAYLRFSILGGVIARHIRNLGYPAKAHTVMDGDVLQPPLLLLSGLGEVSRIGEVILNPYLGPRLKSGVVTTTMPMAHDKPIDFGLQRFCASCNKCARECPSGAITAGPKRMFNGYEIWKSDSQKCATYRITTPGGSMCGRCMKTCPWNLEGLFAEAPFRWAAMHIPAAAPALARLDDIVGNGGLNPVKKWWWDIDLAENGTYVPPTAPVNARGIQPKLKITAADQTLAVYPAPLAPPPWPFPFPMDREAGIAAYGSMLSAKDHKARVAAGDESHVHRYTPPTEAPVIAAEIASVDTLPGDTRRYRFKTLEDVPLPAWTAGAHIDVVVTPEFIRQYSLCGDPAKTDTYDIAVLNEPDGRGGSKMMHRIFAPGRRVTLSKPINHFELTETATMTYLMGGGIGITPMIAFAHRLHALCKPFALHYCVPTRARAAFADDLQNMPWADHVHLHISDENTRADLAAILGQWQTGTHVYTCGPARFMDAVIETATQLGFPEDTRHLEYFSVPEQPAYENHPFTLRLRDGRQIDVAPDTAASDALLAAGVHVDIKCGDGLCGVCKCGYSSGTVEHRDFVLSSAQRETTLILCQSRAASPGEILEIDL